MFQKYKLLVRKFQQNQTRRFQENRLAADQLRIFPIHKREAKTKSPTAPLENVPTCTVYGQIEDHLRSVR